VTVCPPESTTKNPCSGLEVPRAFERSTVRVLQFAAVEMLSPNQTVSDLKRNEKTSLIKVRPPSLPSPRTRATSPSKAKLTTFGSVDTVDSLLLRNLSNRRIITVASAAHHSFNISFC